LARGWWPPTIEVLRKERCSYWRQLNEGTVNSISSHAYTDKGHAPSFSDNLVEVVRAN
jgi:hypothetical protein